MGFLGPLILGALKTVGKDVAKNAYKGVMSNISGGGQKPDDQGAQNFAPPPRPGEGLMPAPQASQPASTDLMAPYKSQPSLGLDPSMAMASSSPSAAPPLGAGVSAMPAPSPGTAAPAPATQSGPGAGRKILGVLQGLMRPQQNY